MQLSEESANTKGNTQTNDALDPALYEASQSFL